MLKVNNGNGISLVQISVHYGPNYFEFVHSHQRSPIVVQQLHFLNEVETRVGLEDQVVTAIARHKYPRPLVTLGTQPVGGLSNVNTPSFVVLTHFGFCTQIIGVHG